MRKSELERMLGEKASPRKGYSKYYAAIGGAFAAGNALAYMASGMSGLMDALGLDLITFGFTMYEQLKMKQENERIDSYIHELHEVGDEDKIALLSFGGSNTKQEKAVKIGYIIYRLLQDDFGENEFIEDSKGLSSSAIGRLHENGYVKDGLFGMNLTKKGKLAYYSIFNGLKKEGKNAFRFLKEIYTAPEAQIDDLYNMYLKEIEEKARK